jgi:imidazolonepropionase-like amidohydrolase
MNRLEKSCIALVNGTLIDGNRDSPVPNSTVVLRGKRIEEVGKRDEIIIPDGAMKWDVTGKIILPGFMDAHVHLAAYAGDQRIESSLWRLENPAALKILHAFKNAKETLMAGFTTVRNTGNVTTREPEDIILRDAIQEEIVSGPKILACGGGVSMTAGKGSLYYPAYLPVVPDLGFGERTADGPDEVRKEVRRRLRIGADFIKIYTSGGVASKGDKPEYNNWTLEEIKAATQEAHNFGKKVASHAEGLNGIKNAIMGGVDTIEHACILDDEAIEMMLKAGTFVSTTLVVMKAITQGQVRFPVSNYVIEKAKALTEVHFDSIHRAHEAGVKIVFGTDTFDLLRHGENAAEFRHLVEAGLSPMDAIKAATKNAAEAFDLSNEVGSIEKGKLADLLVINGNPLEDIRLLEKKDRIELIFKAGKVVKNQK